MACGIYCILNLSDGKVYVGSSDDIAGRFRGHLYCLRHNKHHSPHLQAAWNRDGADNFIFFMIEDTSVNSLYVREQHYIDKLNACNDAFGYNVLVQAGSNRGHKFSQEVIAKSRKAHLGQIAWNKDIWKQKVSEEELVSYYKSGNSMRDCQNKFGISIDTVRMVMKDNNVLRTKAEALALPKARKHNSESKKGHSYLRGIKHSVPHWRKDEWKSKVSLIDLLNFYKKGFTIEECAVKFNICADIVSRILNENNAVRSSFETRLFKQNKTLVEA
jgi:group I intron endonuclease